jgi:CubicO group peptidase (beta-lactamase class C family)
MFGAWRGRDEVVSGALATALPGVPATRAVYFRIGNTTESFETTLLMQFVDRGKLRLDDKVSKWYPRLPLADPWRETLERFLDRFALTAAGRSGSTTHSRRRSTTTQARIARSTFAW